LQRRGYAHDIVEATVERLRTLGWLDDAAFARQWVENRLAFRPRGRARLRAELRQKGIAPALIEAALRDLDETSLALEAGRKILPRYQGLSWPVFARRLSGYLARRGFPPDVVRQVVQQLWQTSRPSSDPELDSGQGAEAW
jgi:regulatory protein